MSPRRCASRPATASGRSGPTAIAAWIGLARELEWEKIEIEPFEVRADDVPDSCDALFIISPQRPFSAEEVDVVDRYLMSGGNVLLAFDPVLKKEALTPTGFEASLEQRGILVGSDLVIENDTAQQLPGNPGDLFLVTNIGTHRAGGHDSEGVAAGSSWRWPAPSTSPMEATRRCSSGRASTRLPKPTSARAIDPDAKGEPTPPSAVPLAVAWEYVAPLGDDLKPVELDGPTPGRLLVLGDSDWMSPELLDNPQLSNIDFLSSTAGWLTQRRP